MVVNLLVPVCYLSSAIFALLCAQHNCLYCDGIGQLVGYFVNEAIMCILIIIGTYHMFCCFCL